MTLRLIQIITRDGQRQVLAGDDDGSARVIEGVATTYALAQKAIAAGRPIADAVAACGLGETIDVAEALAEKSRAGAGRSS